MIELVLHPNTELELQQFTNRSSHAALIVGNEGAGKMAVATWLASHLLNLTDTESLEQYPHFRVIAPEGQAISIEAIRDLLGFTKLKVPRSNGGTQRLIIIENAGAMTVEAQNALLKLLEEPPEGTVFLLNVTNLQSLLPTVRSRAVALTLKQPARQDLEKYFSAQGFDEQQVHSAYLMSGGLPGLMHALLHDKEEHPLIKAVAQARGLLRSSTFERLSTVDSLAKQKAACMKLLFVLQQMAHAAITQAAEKKNSARALAQWQHVLAVAYKAETEMDANAQPKLVLANLMLNL